MLEVAQFVASKQVRIVRDEAAKTANGLSKDSKRAFGMAQEGAQLGSF
jgi:hypothetical protein